MRKLVLCAALAAVAGFFAPAAAIAAYRRRRVRRFDAQLTEALQQMANALRAGQTLQQALERLVLVSSTDRALWPTVAATLLDAFDIVLARPPRHLRAADARRLAARARERGAVLIVSGGEWPERADVRLTVTRNEWHGLGEGHGRLRGRRVEVVTGGRGAAARERLVALWLPAADGGISLADALADSVDEEPIGGVIAPPIALST